MHRHLVLIFVAAGAAACSSSEGGGAAGIEYPADAPHLSCQATANAPCCDPPATLVCPEGSELEVIQGEGGAVSYVCYEGDFTAAGVFIDGVSLVSYKVDGAFTRCDRETGKVTTVLRDYIDGRGSRRPCNVSCPVSCVTPTVYCDELAPCTEDTPEDELWACGTLR